MKRRTLITSSILLILCMNLVKAVNPRLLSDKELIRKYAAPQHIANGLAQHTNFLLQVGDDCPNGREKANKRREKHLVWEFKSLPGYFVKFGRDRIIGIEILRTCIERSILIV